MTEVIDTQMSSSLALYQANRGWKVMSTSFWKQLARKLKTKRPRRIKNYPNSFLLTPPFNQLWNFHHHPKPIECVVLYCKTFRKFFSFDELPLVSSEKQLEIRFSESELSLLKELNQKGVVQITFLPHRLILEYALDNYWIKLPLIPLEQLSRLLIWLPYTQLFLTQSNIHIWAYLTKKVVNWLKTELGWVVRSIIPSHYSSHLDIA